MMREVPAGWSDIDVDPTLRLLAERAARTAGLPVAAWIERAIRGAYPQYFESTAAVSSAPASIASADPPYPDVPPQPPSRPTVRGAGAALAELIARARQMRSEPRPAAPPQPQIASSPASPLPQPTIALPAVDALLDTVAPALPASDTPTPDAPLRGDESAGQSSPLERVLESKREAAAFASEVAVWRGHDERQSDLNEPRPAFDESVTASYVPFGDSADAGVGKSLELRNPMRAWRSGRPLLIAAGIALVIALGALGAQKFVVERLSHHAPSASANLSAPPVVSSQNQPQHLAPPLSPTAPSVKPTRSAHAAISPSGPPTSTPPMAANGTAAPAPPSPATPPRMPSPTPATTATPSNAPPQPIPRAVNPSPAASVPASPTAAPLEPKTATEATTVLPDMPPPLPRRKLAAEKAANATAAQQAAAAAREAATAAAPKDPAQLARQLEQQVKSGDPVAEYRLGVLYALGQGVKQDYGHAAALFKAAADGGIAEAQYNVAVMYSEGMGVQRNPALAAIWYKKAAAQGNANAAFNLGVAYSNGTGVPQDIQEAVRWFRRAAVAGVINAQFNLGLLYERGEGVRQSLIEAYAWYAAAAARGDQGSAQRRDHIARTLAPADLKKAKTRAAQLQKIIQLNSSPVLTQKANATSP